MEGLSDYVDTWCNKHDIDNSILTNWKYEVIRKVDEKIQNLPDQKCITKQDQPSLCAIAVTLLSMVVFRFLILISTMYDSKEIAHFNYQR